jgi:hypothetical protein
VRHDRALQRHHRRPVAQRRRHLVAVPQSHGCHRNLIAAGELVWQGEVVTDTDTVGAPRRPRSTLSLARRVIGVSLLVVAAVAAVLFVLGSWNPWHLVFLEYRFGNTMLGLLVVPVAALVGLFLLPLRSETRPRGRVAGRVTAFVFSLVGLFAWGLFGTHFTYDVEEVASSDDGERRLAMVSDRDTPPNSHLKVWTGSGLAAREVGDVGQTCGPVQVRFITDDQIELDTSYGTWRIDLDPATGEPRQVLGPRCSDGPIPATLGP